MQTILITGASGFLGKACCAAFTSAGCSVRALVRDVGAQDYLQPVAQGGIFRANLPDSIDEAAFQGEVRAVIHCAYTTTGSSKQTTRETNLTGTRRLRELAQRHNVRQFVFISSMAAHLGARSMYGLTKWQLEQEMTAPSDSIVKPGTIIGQGGIFERTLRWWTICTRTDSTMHDALIGYSGFVGSTLMKQTRFSALYRSTNIAEINGVSFDTAVCSAAPAQKWIANKDPSADRNTIDSLIAHLATVHCETFVLISTVDVFANPRGVDEDSVVDKTGLHAYGLNRRRLEEFVEQHFAHHIIVRLPGLVGPGLRKNIIFDFHNNNLQAIESRASYQFYPMVNLWYDIQTALRCGLRLVHLTTEPLRADEVATLCFGLERFDNALTGPPADYDFQSKHAALYNRPGRYQYGRNDAMLAIRAYAQSEPLTIKP